MNKNSTLPTQPSEQDLKALTECLKDQKATLYGIGWCPYSRKQQQMFGDQLKDVNFVDCGVKDSNEMNEFCQSKGIRGFPSWEFEGNRIVPGFQPYERLRLLAGCVEKKKK